MRAFAALTICATLQTCACWDLDALSPTQWAVASANWNATMKAHRDTLQAPANGTCNKDMRKAMPPCLQFTEDWCWATAVSEVSLYYKPELLPNRSDRYCEGLECKVVGNKMSPGKSPCCDGKKVCAPGQCCQVWFTHDVLCEKSGCYGLQTVVDDSVCEVDRCKMVSAEVDDIAKQITAFSGKQHVAKIDGPLKASELDAILDKGHPVAIGVSWGQGGGHALVIGGCGAAGGPYFVHDSLDKSNSYQSLSYEQVLDYRPPWGPYLHGQWFGTAYPSDALPAASESIVV